MLTLSWFTNWASAEIDGKRSHREAAEQTSWTRPDPPGRSERAEDWHRSACGERGNGVRRQPALRVAVPAPGFERLRRCRPRGSATPGAYGSGPGSGRCCRATPTAERTRDSITSSWRRSSTKDKPRRRESAIGMQQTRALMRPSSRPGEKWELVSTSGFDYTEGRRAAEGREIHPSSRPWGRRYKAEFQSTAHYDMRTRLRTLIGR